MGKVCAYELFLPNGQGTPPPLWRVLYSRGPVTLYVEVCAASEEEAAMRAGMKRAEMFRLERSLFPNLSRVKWERESVNLV